VGQVEVEEIDQEWWVGTNIPDGANPGCLVQTDTIVKYLDHAVYIRKKSPPDSVNCPASLQ
jgi:hypothetical protein